MKNKEIIYGPEDDDYGRDLKPWANNEMEICILCGKATTVPKNLHIDMRNHYIEGAGQLCNECGEGKKYDI